MHKTVLGVEDKYLEEDVPFLELYRNLLPNGVTIMFNRSFLIIIKDTDFNTPFLVGKIEDPREQ